VGASTCREISAGLWHCEGLLIIDSGPVELYKLGEAGEWKIDMNYRYSNESGVGSSSLKIPPVLVKSSRNVQQDTMSDNGGIHVRER
jgi:hypothetical protein